MKARAFIHDSYILWTAQINLGADKMHWAFWVDTPANWCTEIRGKRKVWTFAGLHCVACGRVRWLSDSPVQDTAVLWALSNPARVLIQEGYMLVLDKLQNTVGSLMKPIIGWNLP